jgi:hypothetical protein
MKQPFKVGDMVTMRENFLIMSMSEKSYKCTVIEPAENVSGWVFKIAEYPNYLNINWITHINGIKRDV